MTKEAKLSVIVDEKRNPHRSKGESGRCDVFGRKGTDSFQTGT